MADILLIARDDWGNVGWLFQNALRTVGVDALAVKQRPHAFGYPEQADVLSNDEITKFAQEAKGLLLLHSRAAVSGVSLASKFCAVFHGGSAYRRNPDGVNAAFNPIVNASIIQSADLLGLGAKNETWIMPPVDTALIEAAPLKFAGALQVAHYPSKPDTKGFDTVNAVMDDILADPEFTGDVEWSSSSETIPWEDNLKRMAECDIYIEACNPEINGKVFGEWGLQTMEAAALGRIVVTHSLQKDLYERTFGKCPLVVANSAEELNKVIRDLLRTHKSTLRKIAKDTRKWIVRNHSFKAVGEQLKAVFEPCL